MMPYAPKNPSPQSSVPGAAGIPALGAEAPSVTVMGIDPSLTGTGLVVLDQDGAILHREVVSTKPGPVLPRLAAILPTVALAYSAFKPDLVVIEGLVQDRFGSGNDRAGLHWLIRWRLNAEDHLVVVFPSMLKKWVCGSGKAEKQLMLMKVLKRWGQEFENDNLADAYCLAQWGLAFLRGEVAAPAVKAKKTKKVAQ